MPGSVSIKSTGQRASSTASTNMRTMTSDPANPHVGSGAAFTKGYEMGPTSASEYREIPSPGITSTGVGNFKGNDAAHESVVKHP